MEQILEDLREMIDNGSVDDILEFAEILMVQNKSLMEDNEKLKLQARYFLNRIPEPEPEPEPEYRGTEKLEYHEGLTIFPDEVDFKNKKLEEQYLKQKPSI
jgi:hypothetical protein